MSVDGERRLQVAVVVPAALLFGAAAAGLFALGRWQWPNFGFPSPWFGLLGAVPPIARMLWSFRSDPVTEMVDRTR